MVESAEGRARVTGPEEDAEVDEPPELSTNDLGVVTKIGGAFYLINVMMHLELPEIFESTWRSETSLSAWALLDVLTRVLLPADVEDLERDPLWSCLAALDGRLPEERPGSGWTPVERGGFVLPAPLQNPPDSRLAPFEVPDGPLVRGLNPDLLRWVSAVLPFIRRRLSSALGLGDGIGPGSRDQLSDSLLMHEARIVVTSSHVDVVMPLESISLPVRVAGLDRNPGWWPRLGRVVYFHFQ